MDVAGFVGVSERGPIDRATRIRSWDEYVATFGHHLVHAYLSHAVEGFFANGGRACWIVRAADRTAAARARAEIRDAAGTLSLWVEAANEGSWGNSVYVVLQRESAGGYELQVDDRASGSTERWGGLSLNEASDRFILTVVNDEERGSRLIAVTLTEPDSRSRSSGPLRGGADGIGSITPSDMTGDAGTTAGSRGLRALEDIAEIGIVAAPDAHPVPVRVHSRREPACPPCNGEDEAARPSFTIETRPETVPFRAEQTTYVQQELVAQCIRQRDRTAIIDPPDLQSREALQSWRNSAPGSAFAAVYHPWLLVADPDAPGDTLLVPPSGHVAGLYARTEAEDGVHRAPANRELVGALGTAIAVGDRDHALLNELCVNVVRRYSGRGIRVFGARTLHCSQPWRYVSVRRLMSMIEQSVARSSRWLTFEGSEPRVWSQVERVVGAFLDSLWRAGMLDGRAASEAYFVRCDDTTMTQDDIDNGRLICRIGVNPPRPAELIEIDVALSPQPALTASELSNG